MKTELTVSKYHRHWTYSKFKHLMEEIKSALFRVSAISSFRTLARYLLKLQCSPLCTKRVLFRSDLVTVLSITGSS
jgi:hypothetical protein